MVRWKSLEEPPKRKQPAVANGKPKLCGSGPVRITFVTPVFCAAGAEQWMATLAHWLDPDRAVVTRIIVTGTWPISEIAVSWLPRWVQVIHATEVIQDGSMDLAISWGLLNLVELVADIGCPLIDVQHGVLKHPEWQVPLVNVALGAMEKYGATIVGVNEAVRRNFPAEVRGRIKVIPNGADPSRIVPLATREAVRRAVGIPNHAKVTLYVGRICDDKQVQLLVDAAPHLGANWHIVIMGANVHPITRVGENVHILPPQRRVGNWLGAADVLCHPSLHESHCLSINEAWLAGLPVVSCDYVVNREFEERHGKLMWLVPLGTKAAGLAKAIQEACANRNDERVRRAKEVAEEEYTAPVMGRRWSELIWSLCRR